MIPSTEETESGCKAILKFVLFRRRIWDWIRAWSLSRDCGMQEVRLGILSMAGVWKILRLHFHHSRLSFENKISSELNSEPVVARRLFLVELPEYRWRWIWYISPCTVLMPFPLSPTFPTLRTIQFPAPISSNVHGNIVCIKIPLSQHCGLEYNIWWIVGVLEMCQMIDLRQEITFRETNYIFCSGLFQKTRLRLSGNTIKVPPLTLYPRHW